MANTELVPDAMVADLLSVVVTVAVGVDHVSALVAVALSGAK